MNEQLLSEGLERLNKAAWFLHDMLYVGEKPPLTLRDDLPVDVTTDLVGLLHDINRAERKLTVATQRLHAKEATHA